MPINPSTSAPATPRCSAPKSPQRRAPNPKPPAMGRQRKRHRNAKPPADRAEREVLDDDDATTNQAMAEPSVAGDCEEASEEEDIGKLLELFTRDELLDLLSDACLRDPALLARLADSADSHRRLFVHGLGPDATSAALAAAFAPFGALEECHAVADHADGRCRGYGFVTFCRRSDASKRVGGRPVACQFASIGRAAPSSQRKLFVTNVPERAAHDELRGFFSRFGEVDKGPLGADPATGLFRGSAIFLYKTPGGLKKALEEPNKVFDGCELLCRRALRVSKWKHYTGVAADTGGHSNDAAVAASSPAVQTKDLALASEKPVLSSNPPVGLTAKGSSSRRAPPPIFRQNAAAGGAGILGACPSATAVSSSLPRQNASSTQPSCSGAAFGHVGLSTTAKASGLHSVPATTGASNSVSSLQFQGSAALTSYGLSSLGA